MTYWLFPTQAEAEAAEAQCADSLPRDSLASGAPAPTQVTQRWADVISTTDGRFGFPACPLVAVPVNATVVSDDEWTALQPRLPIGSP